MYIERYYREGPHRSEEYRREVRVEGYYRLAFPRDSFTSKLSRTVVAPPSSVVKCLWEVFVWGLGRCSCRVSGVLLSVGVCVCVTY